MAGRTAMTQVLTEDPVDGSYPPDSPLYELSQGDEAAFQGHVLQWLPNSTNYWHLNCLTCPCDFRGEGYPLCLMSTGVIGKPLTQHHDSTVKDIIQWHLTNKGRGPQRYIIPREVRVEHATLLGIDGNKAV